MGRSHPWLIACTYSIGLAVGVFLLFQHWVHVPAILPYLFFAACPLMHLFMHHGHGGDHRHKHVENPRSEENRTA